MFGFSFGEILVIAIIAVIFLGPDKLPKAFVDIAKFLKAAKKTINDAKDVIDREVQISEIKKEALEYKKQFEGGITGLKDDISKSADLSEITNILNEPLDSNADSTINVDSPKGADSAKNIDSMEALENESKAMLENLKSKTTLKPKIKHKNMESIEFMESMESVESIESIESIESSADSKDSSDSKKSKKSKKQKDSKKPKDKTKKSKDSKDSKSSKKSTPKEKTKKTKKSKTEAK